MSADKDLISSAVQREAGKITWAAAMTARLWVNFFCTNCTKSNNGCAIVFFSAEHLGLNIERIMMSLKCFKIHFILNGFTCIRFFSRPVFAIKY